VRHLANVADMMHALLVARADEFDGCTEGSPEEAGYIKLVETIEATRPSPLAGRSHPQRQGISFTLACDPWACEHARSVTRWLCLRGAPPRE
jgi:hypothetical protein